MDQPLRAPWRAMIRYVVFGVGIAAALVLLSLVLGARPAAAAPAPAQQTLQTHPSQQRGLVGGVVDGLGGTRQGRGGGGGLPAGKRATTHGPATPLRGGFGAPPVDDRVVDDGAVVTATQMQLPLD
ncbi:hypothetical protein [Curtobacterium sp. CT11-133]|uniref:hypothetical protein n=1 Tax=Curtobacterium sp. CT11-133 TaxID=3243014 RepID=UPI0039AF47D1